MVDIQDKYQELVARFKDKNHIASGQMFGKRCLKVNGKAFISQHKDTIVFKLSGAHHAKAIALQGAILWDPSGKGRPMKEWIALPASQSRYFNSLADAAMEYVEQSR